MKSTYLLMAFIFCTLLPPIWASPAEKSTCLKQVALLKVPRDQVAEFDGIWGLFQKNAELQGFSALSINLDKMINSMIFHLEYLCDTIDGIPFDELSDYVSTNLTEKGAQKFKEELIVLGRNEGQIEVWFEFTKFAVANRYRVLQPEKIALTSQSAQPFIKRYLQLAKRIDRKENLGSVIEEAQTQTNQIQTFFETDPYMSQAIHENSQIPFVDWDENYGGS